MRQTFYIDIDEEISSVIDRLNKSVTAENYFVVPGRAIFLQSIVNLKLLKREADKLGKRVVLVTQDEIGISMAQRSGIEASSSLEGLDSDFEQQDRNIEILEDEELENESKISDDYALDDENYQDKQIRLSSIGSREFYESSPDYPKEKPVLKGKKSLSRRIPVNLIDRTLNQTNSMRKKISAYPLQQKEESRMYKKGKSQTDIHKTSMESKKPIIFRKNNQHIDKIDAYKERTLEKMFAPLSNDRNKLSKTSERLTEKKESKVKKIFLGFILLCLLSLAGVAVYLLVPNVEIIIKPNILKDKTDVNIHGVVDAQADMVSNIPIRVVEQSQDVSLSYTVTGKGLTSGKKAHGSVVIYNEYSSSSQPLIATTRLESPDGKIFRLVKNVVVPGTTMVNGTQQPGAIEAEVIADQAGSDYNIEQTKFTVPGFSGSPKFEKFYAKSSASFSGGSSDGDGGTATVSQKDIDDAKIKTEAALNDKIKEALNGQLQPGEIALPQVQKITTTKSLADVKVGDIATEFNYTISANVVTLVFSEEDVKKIILNNHQNVQDSREDISKIEYGSLAPNFENSSIDMKVLSEVTLTPEINIQEIKKEVLGKNADQLGDILMKYSSIKNADAKFWPSFMSSVPQYSQRVDIKIDTSEQ